MNKIIRVIITTGMSLFAIMLLVVVVMASLEASSAADVVIICLLSIVVIINAYMVFRLAPRKRIKAVKEVKQLDYDEFETIYEKLLKMYKKEVDGYRKPIARKIIREVILIIVIISTFVTSTSSLEMYLMLICLMAIILLTISMMIKTNTRDAYLKVFNEKVVVGLIKLLDDNISSKDEIIENYEIAYRLEDNETSSITCNKDDENDNIEDNGGNVANEEGLGKNSIGSGTKNKMNVFIHEGIRVVVEAPKIIPATIIVENDISDLNELLKRDCQKVEMDSSEFEEVFSVYSDNPIMALQLLTSDIMEVLMEFEKTFESSIEFKLTNNRIYFHFYKEDAIVPSIFSEDLNKEKLLEYYTLITAVRKICFKIYEQIKEI